MNEKSSGDGSSSASSTPLASVAPPPSRSASPDRPDALGGDQPDDLVDLGVGVGREAVDRHDAPQAVDVADGCGGGGAGWPCHSIAWRSSASRSASATPPWYFSARTVATTTAKRAQPGLAALDVDELLRTQIGAEAGLGHHEVGQPQAGPGGDHRVAAVGDVRERAAVHERRRVLEGLHQIRSERVAEDAVIAPWASRSRAVTGPLVRVADDDVADALLQVDPRFRQAEDRHELRGHDDVEPLLAGEPVGCRPARRRSGATRGR